MGSYRNSNSQVKKAPSFLPLVRMMYSNTTLGLLKISAWDETPTVVFEVKLLPYSAP